MPPASYTKTAMCYVHFEFKTDNTLSSHAMSCEEALGFSTASKIHQAITEKPFENVTIAYTTTELSHRDFCKINHGIRLDHSKPPLTHKKFTELMRCAEAKPSCKDWLKCINETRTKE